MQVQISGNNPTGYPSHGLRAANTETETPAEVQDGYAGSAITDDEAEQQRLRRIGKGLLVLGAVGMLATAATLKGIDAGVIERGSRLAVAVGGGGLMTGMIGLTAGGSLLMPVGK